MYREVLNLVGVSGEFVGIVAAVPEVLDRFGRLDPLRERLLRWLTRSSQYISAKRSELLPESVRFFIDHYLKISISTPNMIIMAIPNMIIMAMFLTLPVGIHFATLWKIFKPESINYPSFPELAYIYAGVSGVWVLVIPLGWFFPRSAMSSSRRPQAQMLGAEIVKLLIDYWIKLSVYGLLDPIAAGVRTVVEYVAENLLTNKKLLQRAFALGIVIAGLGLIMQIAAAALEVR